MRTLSLKFPVHLEALVAREAKQQRVSKASVVRSCVEEVLLKRPQAEQQLTCADLAGDLIGSLDGPADLSTNKRYLEEAMEEDFQRGRNDHRRHRPNRRVAEP